jgi:DNA-binding transcriptional regulator YhcF (GntR family)
MVDLDLNIVLDAALRILLIIDNSISVRFSKDAIHIKLPTTRRLADFLEVPHYYVLPILGMMEMDELITRAERVGIHTTNKGSKIFVALMHERYKNEAEALLGPTIFEEIRRRTDQP